MDDKQLIELYRTRNETAIGETLKKYGVLTTSVAENILRNHNDAEEVANDVWLALWNRIPPDEPENFSAYISRVARNQAITRLRHDNTLKRGGSEYEAAVDELSEIIPDSSTTEDIFEERELTRLINKFLDTQKKESRLLFVGRYFHLKSDAELSATFKISKAGVRMSLMRTRNAMKKYLEKEGYRI
ncbi:MAG: sigma-70 family RNA polymerase sigma factor [Lachnospiraceae bacterium]|nr:sigma-70 family RNA polymerase sigma factor [Lachnospiraceae bacterium]